MVLRLAADELADARAKARRRRRVSVTPDVDGMAWLSALIGDVDAHRIHHRLSAAAAADTADAKTGAAEAKANGAAADADNPAGVDDRCMDERRADLLVEALLNCRSRNTANHDPDGSVEAHPGGDCSELARDEYRSGVGHTRQAARPTPGTSPIRVRGNCRACDPTVPSTTGKATPPRVATSSGWTATPRQATAVARVLRRGRCRGPTGLRFTWWSTFTPCSVWLMIPLMCTGWDRSRPRWPGSWPRMGVGGCWSPTRRRVRSPPPRRAPTPPARAWPG